MNLNRCYLTQSMFVLYGVTILRRWTMREAITIARQIVRSNCQQIEIYKQALHWYRVNVAHCDAHGIPITFQPPSFPPIVDTTASLTRGW